MRDPMVPADARLRIARHLFIALGFLGLCTSPTEPACAASLPPTAIDRVQASTFEVVAAKPADDPLTYAKPLPLELLPFQERNDHYYSIGTAFQIAEGQYVSAAHVVAIGIGNLWGPPAIRDSQGNVYPLDQIVKFSLARDFVVFTVKNRSASKALTINRSPLLNGTVYAVGNALGTGIVIRDGSFTSQTPEDQDGRWKWMRFSAPASPGNSGGPLLDDQGAVIGLIVRKSPNENLNYALPIEEVLRASSQSADIDSRTLTGLEVFDTTQIGRLNSQIPLPSSFPMFVQSLRKVWIAHEDGEMKALLAKDPDNVFPNGAGSLHLVYSFARMQYFPVLINRNRDGEWAMSEKNPKWTTLSSNGGVFSAVSGRNWLFHLRSPDGVSPKAIRTDPQQFARQLLKTGFLQRQVGSERIQITDVGKPSEDTDYVDSWKRRWQIRIWRLPYANAFLLTMSLPTPDGHSSLARIVPAAALNEETVDLEAVTKFVSMAYWGTLPQWKEFLADPKWLPPFLLSVKVDFEFGGHVTYSSSRVQLLVPNEIQEITPESRLGLGFNYLEDHGQVSMEVGDIQVTRNSTDKSDWINIQRHREPVAGLGPNFQADWDNVLRRLHPYGGQAYAEGDFTRICVMVPPPAGTAPHVVYTAFIGINGDFPSAMLKSKLDAVLTTLHVTEK